MDDAVVIPDRSWLDAPTTVRLIAAFDKGGIDFRFVGGAVRDSLLGRPVSDIDVATSGLPDAVIAALERAGLKAVPTGVEHGTVTAVVDGKPFEVTTLRRDMRTDGRHAIVAFSDDWREDAARRDFTMNALYADRAGRVDDYFGGVADAQVGRVRFIGDPATRIREDALRILRFFRFHAHYGKGALDADGLAACGAHAATIERLSSERVRAELFKLLAAPDPTSIWQAMAAAGVASHLLASSDVRALGEMVATERQLGLPADPLRRLAGLADKGLDDCGAALKTRLKLSNRDAERLAFVARPGARTTLVAYGAFGRALYGAKPELVCDAALLGHVRAKAPDMKRLADFLKFIAGWREPRFPLTGADLRRRGVAQGPAVGRLLREVELWWTISDFTPDRKACLAELERLIAINR